MKCPKCNSKLNIVEVSIEGTKNKVLSNQCSNCDFFEFGKESASKVLDKLKNK